jgi:hypothetical protein
MKKRRHNKKKQKKYKTKSMKLYNIMCIRLKTEETLSEPHLYIRV